MALAPDQVALAQVEQAPAWRGGRARTLARRVEACAGADGARPWQAALAALEAALRGLAGNGMPATVVLSNRFMRYALVPWRAELDQADEDMAYASHCLAEIYGASARQWTTRLSRSGRGAPGLASAVDAALLDGLRDVFDASGVAIRSIQPHLMTVFNRVRGRLRGRSGWLALIESGHLCLALLHQDRWESIRAMRFGQDWPEALVLALAREGWLSDTAAASHDVYLWAPGREGALPALPPPWSVHLLPAADPDWPEAGPVALALEA